MHALAGRAPQGGFHARYEPGRLERLADVVSAPLSIASTSLLSLVEPVRTITGSAAVCTADRRRSECLQALPAEHVEIEHHQRVPRIGRERLQRGEAVARLRNGEAVLFQNARARPRSPHRRRRGNTRDCAGTACPLHPATQHPLDLLQRRFALRGALDRHVPQRAHAAATAARCRSARGRRSR